MAITSDFRRRTLGAQILLRPDDDAWGPFGFDCEPSLPSGVTISSVSATCYTPNGTEEPNLIEVGSESVSDGTTVQLKFDVTSSSIAAGDHYLALVLTLSNGGTKNLAFGPITVEKW